MKKLRRHQLKLMSAVELQTQYDYIANDLKNLSKYVGEINTDEELEEFEERVAILVENVHCIRWATVDLYLNKP